MREYFEMFLGMLFIGGAAIIGFCMLIICTPWFWLAVIAYILATNL